MLHLPEIPFWDIEKNLFGFAVICWNAISLYQMLKHKAEGKKASVLKRKPKSNPKS
jgi:hypothetical protein